MNQATRQYVPLQHFAEQNPMAVKVNAFMVLCGRLEADLTATIRSNFPNFVRHEALEPSVEAVNP